MTDPMESNVVGSQMTLQIARKTWKVAADPKREMMTDQRNYLAGTARIDTAVALLRHLRAQAPEAPLERLALQAVDTVFCARVAFASDAVECRVGDLEAELAAEVMRRMMITEDKPMSSAGSDRVETASEDPFPAIDPPAWVQGDRNAGNRGYNKA